MCSNVIGNYGSLFANWSVFTAKESFFSCLCGCPTLLVFPARSSSMSDFLMQLHAIHGIANTIGIFNYFESFRTWFNDALTLWFQGNMHPVWRTQGQLLTKHLKWFISLFAVGISIQMNHRNLESNTAWCSMHGNSPSTWNPQLLTVLRICRHAYS